MTILCLGLNHRTTPLAHREAFAIEGEAAREALIQLTAHPSIDEAAVLSTCNRTEWYLAASDASAAMALLRDFFQARTGFSASQLQRYLYVWQGRDAVDHLVRVACGLDSMVLGEPQILGQVRDAYEMGLEVHAIGPQLAELFRTAIQTGKRARTETPISRNAVSIGSVVMRWVDGHAALSQSKRLAIVGAGEMGSLVAKHAAGLSDARIRIYNRTLARAQALADRVQATAHPLSQLPDGLSWADAVIVAAGGDGFLITPAMTPRRARPLILVDLSVPRAIDPAVASLPHVELFVLDDIQEIVQHNLEERQAAIPQVEVMVAEAADGYMAWLGSRQVLPVLVGMRRKANDLARAELEQALRKLPHDDTIVADQMTRLTHRLVNKLLHEPTLQLKAQAARGNAEPYARAIQDLFALEDYLLRK